MNAHDAIARGNAHRPPAPVRAEQAIRTEVRMGGGGTNVVMVVVVSVPSNESRFVNTRRIKPSDSDPWDGLFMFDDEEAKPMNCWPNFLGRHFARFIVDDTAIPVDGTIPERAHVFAAVYGHAGWWVMQNLRVTPVEPPEDARITDCYPTGGL